MDDLISRQAAIEQAVKYSQIDGAYGYMDTKSIIDMLNDLPSAQQWIPCDACKYNPPSAKDGKPCTMCPAEGMKAVRNEIL